MAGFERLEQLTVGLYDRGLLKFSDFEWTLKSGRESPLYYNQRPVTSFSEGLVVNGREVPIDRQREVLDLSVDGLSWSVDQLGNQHNHLNGIPQASTVIGGLVALNRGESYLWTRVGKKEHGVTKSGIEGTFVEGDTVVSIDDVITDSVSKREAAEEQAANGLVPVGSVIMFDREEGGAQSLRDDGFDLVAVVGLATSMDILRDVGRIGQQEFDWVAQYHEGLRAEGII